MIKKQSIFIHGVFVVSLSALYLSCSTNTTGVATTQNSNTFFGYLYNLDGSPARGARVTVVPADYVGKSGLTKKAASDSCIITDQNGRFAFDSLSAGTYNIFGAGDGVASYTPSIHISMTANAVLIAKDTLKPTGSIKGIIRLNPQADSRTVLILVMGSYIVASPDDSNGNFSLKNLAPGTYRIRFLAMDSQYPVLDTAFTVVSGIITDVGTIVLSKPYCSAATDVRQLKITSGAIPNWNISNSVDSFDLFTAVSLTQALDGGAEIYGQHGLVEAAIENMEKTANDIEKVTAYFMDFGTDAEAAAMVQYQVSLISDTITIPGYDTTVGLAQGFFDGITVYAHFNKFYIELQLTGYEDQSQAISDAKLFLDIIKSKI